MRDINRIYKFCNQLATIWATECPDLRFGQLMVNILGKMQSEGRDPFFTEEKEMMDYIKKYFGMEDDINE